MSINTNLAETLPLYIILITVPTSPYISQLCFINIYANIFFIMDILLNAEAMHIIKLSNFYDC